MISQRSFFVKKNIYNRMNFVLYNSRNSLQIKQRSGAQTPGRFRRPCAPLGNAVQCFYSNGGAANGPACQGTASFVLQHALEKILRQARVPPLDAAGAAQALPR